MGLDTEAKRVLDRGVARGLVTAAHIHEVTRRHDALGAAGTPRDAIEILQEVAGLDVRTIAALDDRSMVGRTLRGFTLRERLGAGAMGSVYRADQTSLGRAVAVKVLDPVLSIEGEFAERFRREARVAARLDHPNIVQPIDFGEEDGLLFFAMELMDGGSPAKRIVEGPPYDESEALEIGIAIARALEFAEAHHLVHRDIKPDNILFDAHGTPKLADLGLVLERGDARPLTSPGMAMGTIDYMSPEQVQGERNLDDRSDIYSLGISLYEMLTRRRPFASPEPVAIAMKHISAPLPDPRELAPDLSQRMVDILTTMTAKRREDRYPNARALREALELAGAARLVARAASREHEPIVLAEPPARAASPEPPPSPPPPASAIPSVPRRLLPTRRVRAPVAAVAVGLLALIACPIIVSRFLPAGAPATAAVTTSPAAPVVFGEPVALVELDAASAIVGWRREGTSAWGPELDEETNEQVLIAQGTGRLVRDLGPGPWRVEGKIRLRDALEAGVRVERAGGGAVGLALQSFGGRVLARTERFNPAVTSEEPRRGGDAGAPRSFGPDDEVAFGIAVAGGRVRVEVGDAAIGDEALEGPATGVSLYVVRGAAAQFRELVLRQPHAGNRP